MAGSGFLEFRMRRIRIALRPVQMYRQTVHIKKRQLDIVRTSNRAQFDFDRREFAESPQAATYNSSEAGHFAWHSDIGIEAAAGQRKLILV